MSAVERLAEVEARANAATDGPWLVDHSLRDGTAFVCDRNGLARAYARDDVEVDVEFIAHARQDVPDLAAVKALRDVLDLHKRRVIYSQNRDLCAECSDPSGGNIVDWPCPTAQAIEAAIGGEDRG